MITASRRTAAAVAAALAAGTALLFGGPGPAAASPEPGGSGAHSVPVRQVSLRLASDATQVADVYDDGLADDTKIIEWHFKRSANQLWEPDDMGSGYVRFKNVHSGKCLKVKGASTEQNAQIVQGPCGTEPSEQWKLLPKGNGHQLAARSTGMCINVRGGVGAGNELI
ncbi:RICIN domain-containing protein, partial [Streptomyces clavuligerus]